MFSASDHAFAVCAYGESPYLEQCVASLVAQRTRTRILVATSTPNEHIRSVSAHFNVPLVESGERPGIAHDWNFALAAASAPLVTLAHQDDTYEPDYATAALEALDRVEDPLIFFTNYGEIRDGRIVDDDGLLRVKRRLLRPLERAGGASRNVRIKRSAIRLGSAICCPSVTYNVAALPSPPFDGGMASNLDWDAWERFSRLPGSFVYDGRILMHHRIHEGSETSRLIRDDTRTREDLDMLCRFWPAPVARAINHVYSRGQASNASGTQG